MLIDHKCSIYGERPLTCRHYDCRIFSATGIAAGDDSKARITRRIRRWKFSYPTQRDRNQHLAVHAAAIFLREHAECFPPGVIPSNSTRLAVFAIKVYDVFLKYNDKAGKIKRVPPDIEVAKAIMKAKEKFESRHAKSAGVRGRLSPRLK